MNYGGEVKVIEKINRLESYLSEGLPRYQDVFEERGNKIPQAPKGLEYKSPGIMESQIFTVLTKRFKSGRLSFSKFGATCLSKICAIKVQESIVEIEEIEKETQIDNSIQEYINEVKEALKKPKKALIKLDRKENKINEYNNICIEPKKTIYQALRAVPISELDYII